jgi:hypothetical protein
MNKNSEQLANWIGNAVLRKLDSSVTDDEIVDALLDLADAYKARADEPDERRRNTVRIHVEHALGHDPSALALFEIVKDDLPDVQPHEVILALKLIAAKHHGLADELDRHLGRGARS